MVTPNCSIFSPPDVRIVGVGTDYRHDANFVVERPKGSGNWTFVNFPTGIRILSAGGRKLGRPGACIVYAPDQPQWYCGDSGGFVNHWMHFDGRDVRELLKSYAIPNGRLFYPERAHFIPVHLTALETEFVHAESRWEESVALQIQAFFLRISRAMTLPGGNTLSPRLTELKPAMQSVRLRIHQNYSLRWNVGGMARLANVSPSRFFTLYKLFFGLSPVEDLIQVRVEKARWMLTNSALKVSVVAKACGFESDDYFFRVFRKRVGCTPGAYYGMFMSKIRGAEEIL